MFHCYCRLCLNEDPLLPQVNMRLKKSASVGNSQCRCDPSPLSYGCVCARPSGCRVMLLSTLYFFNEFSPLFSASSQPQQRSITPCLRCPEFHLLVTHNSAVGEWLFYFWERSAQDFVSTDIAVESKVICFVSPVWR